MADDDRRRGRFLGMPYDWRKPTRSRLKQDTWNDEDDRVLRPKTFGWGYGINLRGLVRRLTGR
jgi:hypothetical protein